MNRYLLCITTDGWQLRNLQTEDKVKGMSDEQQNRPILPPD